MANHDRTEQMNKRLRSMEISRMISEGGTGADRYYNTEELYATQEQENKKGKHNND